MYGQALREVNEVLENMDEKYTKLISPDFMKMMIENIDWSYDFKYDTNKNELILKDVIGDFDKDKIKNINVVTSGLSDSFSSGLLIGKIKETNKDTYGLSYTFTLSPASNFNNINIVSVIKGGK